MDDIAKRLQKPFSADDIEWRVGATNRDKTKGMALAYVTNRAIQNRLDEVFGPFGWKNEYIEWQGKSQLCGISVWDDGKKEWITKYDGADNTDFESTKGGLSDAMKRAAYQWGIGRYLYNLKPQWCPIKQVGKSYILDVTPELPLWALPDCKKVKSETSKSKDTISVKQAAKLFVIAKNDQALVKEALGSFGYENTTDIPKKEYDAICKAIEQATVIKEGKK